MSTVIAFTLILGVLVLAIGALLWTFGTDYPRCHKCRRPLPPGIVGYCDQCAGEFHADHRRKV